MRTPERMARKKTDVVCERQTATSPAAVLNCLPCKFAQPFIFTFGSLSPADERRARKHPNTLPGTAEAEKPGGFFLPDRKLIPTCFKSKGAPP
jgi:hypothetical protein